VKNEHTPSATHRKKRQPLHRGAESAIPFEQWDAARIIALRKRLGWTQREMAERFHMRQQTISEWETGKYTPTNHSCVLLTALARRYQFSD